MKKPFIVLLALTFIFLFSCKNKKQEEKNFFPALSFIKSQVAQIDTSLYTIKKVVTIDSVSDTTFIKRDQFKEAAKDFLSLPDITSNRLKDDYVETKMYDADLKQAIFNYMPQSGEADKVEIKRQEVMIRPMAGGDKVSSIFIDQVKPGSDSSVHKILFWEVDNRFKVVTSVQKQNLPEKTQTLEVIWTTAPSAE